MSAAMHLALIGFTEIFLGAMILAAIVLLWSLIKTLWQWWRSDRGEW